MVQSLSMDLRWRLFAAIDDGMSCRVCSSSLWGCAIDGDPLAGTAARDRQFAPKPQGGDMRSRGVESGGRTFWALGSAQGHLA
jgi:hypothetical protein